jgi:hypothetical protein
MTVSGLISIALLMNKGQAKFAEYALEAVFLSYSSLALWWAKRNEFVLSIAFIRWGCLIYLGLSYIYAVDMKGADLQDFLLIYKSFVYLFFLSLLAGKKLMTYEGTNKLLFILLGLFFVKYVAMIAVKGEDRPILYMENNFELMLLYALFLVRYTVTKKNALLVLGFVGLITILSLSRSSLLMYSVLVLFVFYNSYEKIRVFIIPAAILLLGGVILFIFSQRDSSIEDIDRFKFMMVWWSQVKDWNLFEWLFGAPRITNLSAPACRFFYLWHDTLFSRSGNGTCYSVVFHSFLLRAIFDHGILGLVFIIFAAYKILVVSGVRKGVAVVFVSIVIINGLSVSSFNNLFYAVSTVFLMATNTEFSDNETEDKLIEEEVI